MTVTSALSMIGFSILAYALRKYISMLISAVKHVIVMKKTVRQFPMKRQTFGDWRFLPTTHDEWMEDWKLTVKHPRCIGVEACYVLPYLQVTHPETIKKIVKADPHKGFLFESLFKPWQGDNGLLTIYGPKWRIHRKLISPCLNGDYIRSYVDTIKSCTDLLICELNTDNSNKGHHGIDNTKSNIRIYVADAAIKCLFSKDEKSKVQSSTKAISKTVEFMFNKSMCEFSKKPYYYSDFIFSLTSAGQKAKQERNALIDYAKSMIEKRIKEKELSINQHDSTMKRDLLDALLDENGKNLDMEDIIDEVRLIYKHINCIKGVNKSSRLYL